MTFHNTQMIGFYTIFRKEIMRIFRIWTQTLLPSVITTSLYFMIFGHFIGSRVGVIKGVSYLEFIIPGLIMMALINNSYGNVVSSVFGAKFSRSIEELLVSPLYNFVIIMGFLFGGFFRGLLVSLFVSLVSSFFVSFSVHNFTIMVFTIILSSFLFSLAGFVNALLAKNFDDISIIPVFILTPLIYLGGVFYSIDMLSSFWRLISLFNPIFYIINLFRFSIIGISESSIYLSLFFLLFFNFLLGFICYYMFKKGVGLKN